MSQAKWNRSGRRGFVLVVEAPSRSEIIATRDLDQLLADQGVSGKPSTRGVPPAFYPRRRHVQFSVAELVSVWLIEAVAAGAVFESLKRAGTGLKSREWKRGYDSWPLTERTAAHFAKWFVDVASEGASLRPRVVGVTKEGSTWTIRLTCEKTSRRYEVVLEDRRGLPVLARLEWEQVANISDGAR